VGKNSKSKIRCHRIRQGKLKARLARKAAANRAARKS
jgi:hypothetical protein